MKCYLPLILLLICTVCNAQQHEENIDSKKHKPYIELMISGGSLSLTPTAYELSKRIKEVVPGPGYVVQAGMDLMIDKGKHHIFPSFGCNIGYMSFASGEAVHFDGNAGIHYINKPGNLQQLRLALYLGGGTRFQDFLNTFFLPFLNPYYYVEANATRSFSSVFSAGLSAARYSVLRTEQNPITERMEEFTGLTIEAQLRLRIGGRR